MAHMYGTSFQTIYGEAPNPLWVKAITQLTDDQCRDGLASLAKEKRAFPANMTEFISACKPPLGSPRYLGGNPIIGPMPLPTQEPKGKAWESIRKFQKMQANWPKDADNPKRVVKDMSRKPTKGCTCPGAIEIGYQTEGTCEVCKYYKAI